VTELAVGQLAQQLHTGYLAYAATRDLLAHPGIQTVVEVMRSENVGPAPVPIGSIRRGDGSEIVYDLPHAIEVVGRSAGYRDVYDQLWLAGAVLTLGDALAAEHYFDRGPDLELLRHLRNGIAHGNRFNLRKGEPRRPAHFTGPDQRFLDGGTTPTGQSRFFEITPACQGKAVLFEFMGPGDIVDLLIFVSWRLIRRGNGDPPYDLFPQRSSSGSPGTA
jgi:hypothetical protein